MRAWGWTLLAAVAGIGLCADSRAQSSGGPYVIPTQVVSAGGGRSTGGNFQLEGTIGQQAVGPPASGTTLELLPGFRRQRFVITDELFADGFENP